MKSAKLNGSQVLRSDTVADLAAAVAEHGLCTSQGVAAFLLGVPRLRVWRMVKAQRIHILRCPAGDWVFLNEVQADLLKHNRR